MLPVTILFICPSTAHAVASILMMNNNIMFVQLNFALHWILVVSWYGKPMNLIDLDVYAKYKNEIFKPRVIIILCTWEINFRRFNSNIYCTQILAYYSFTLYYTTKKKYGLISSDHPLDLWFREAYIIRIIRLSRPSIWHNDVADFLNINVESIVAFSCSTIILLYVLFEKCEI